MISELFDALDARIELGQGLAGKVYDTLRFNPEGGLIREQYVILYRTAPMIGSDRLAAVADVNSILTFNPEIRVVGTSPQAVAVTTDRVLGQVVGHRLVVVGRSCSPITVDSVGRVLTDTSVKDFLFYSDISLELVSEPA